MNNSDDFDYEYDEIDNIMIYRYFVDEDDVREIKIFLNEKAVNINFPIDFEMLKVLYEKVKEIEDG